MKIITSSQTRRIDSKTIEAESITSISLMERASMQVFRWIKQHFPFRSFYLFAGPGNNGGDALAVARMLLNDGFCVKIFLYRSQPLSPDAQTNLKRLKSSGAVSIVDLSTHPLPESIPDKGVIIDGLFGSGLNRPLNDRAAAIVHFINRQSKQVVSIDTPSGLFCEDNSTNLRDNIVKATFTLSFQTPKLAFFFPENQFNVGKWHVLPIGLDDTEIQKMPSPWQMITLQQIQEIMPHRHTFDHKGLLGHALLIAGCYGKMGAALMASSACLKSGVGLLTTHVPHTAPPILHEALPEAMVSIDRSDLMFTEFPDLKPYKAIGAGPGIGTGANTWQALRKLLHSAGSLPLVLDADALNLLSAHPETLSELPDNTILTPHPKEFERLAGTWHNDYHRMQKAITFARDHHVILVVKGAWTMIVDSEGQVFFNSTGNPGMATAGSGDTLTGIILALLARGMPPLHAALTGVFTHGLAGDIACSIKGAESLTASDIIACLGRAFSQLSNK